MRILLCCFLVGFFSMPALSQKSPIKYGDIPMEDMTMTIYPLDSSAGAVVLVDYGETTGFQLERHVRIKILTKDGLGWADAMVPIFSGSKITSMKAATYNLVGGKIEATEMSKEGIFKETVVKGIDLRKFTLPNVKEGSVIEYFYKMSNVGIPNWEFQKTVPVRWSEYWAMIPEYVTFEKYMQGYLSPNTFETKNRSMTGYQATAYHWILKDVPAFKEEPFMTSQRDYISKVNFALSYIHFPGQSGMEVMGTWKTLNNELLEADGFGKAIERSGFLREEVERITAGVSDPMKKIELIHAHVRKVMEWDGTKDYLTDPLKKVVEKKKGTAADINFLLGSMLNKAGFLVDMVILSTRDHGFIRLQYPMVNQFNYVVCVARVNGKPILLDATEKYLPYTVLPMRCLNGQGLMISNITPDWIDVESKAKARTVLSADLAMDVSGAMKGTLEFTFDGYDAHRMRNDYHKKGEEEYLRSFVHGRSWQIEKTEFRNMDSLHLPVKEVHNVAINEHASSSGNVIYMNPFVHSKEEFNPFKSEKREFPVDFGSPIEKLFMIKVRLPEGYTVDELPQSRVLRLPDNAAKYSYNATLSGDMISIVSNLQISKSLFVMDEYLNLREFYDQVIAKQAEQIVLKKK